MKLGIVVVYYIKEYNGGLLDIHFKQIERHTKVPYTIYGSVNRLSPKFREKVAGQPKVKICDCPETDIRGDDEHIYYAEHLIRMAIEDGCTHIAILHVDSFPIRSDWAEVLAAKLSGTYRFAAPYYGNYTACLFFSSEYYMTCQPKFRLSTEEYFTDKYRQFCRDFDHIPHAGVGFLYKAYVENHPWFQLREYKKRYDRLVFHSNVYNDLIFHLNAAAATETSPVVNTSFIRLRKILWAFFWMPIFRTILLTKVQQKARGFQRFIVPRRILSWMWRHIGFPMFYKPINWYERTELLQDPESYLNSLQTGG